MKNFIISFLNIFLLLITPALCQENPDEYRDCVVYTLEEANAATAPTGNQVIFTFSGLMTRAEVNNVDCGTISYIDAPSSDEDNNDNNNGGGSIIGGSGSSGSSSSGSSSSGSSSGGSSSGGSSSGSSSSGGSSSGGSSSGGSGSSCSNSEGNSGVHGGGCN